MSPTVTIPKIFFCAIVAVATANEYNIVFVLTDNQDLTLGGFTPMSKTRELVAEKGVSFTNAFVATPVCCPSRATILTGRYPHNTGVTTNREAGNCNGEEWRQGPETEAAYAKFLRDSGYETLFVGKYLNRYGLPEAGGIEHVPTGWTHWRALKGNSVYYNYTLSIDGQPETHGFDYERDYFTSVVKRKALSFLENERNSSLPFFMCLSTSAPHDPETPEPKYAHKFSSEVAPRDPAYDLYPGNTKHWLTRMPPSSMSNSEKELIDEKFRNKWRSLLSVDDLVAEVIETLDRQGILDRTYIVFTSDHGFHLGQFTLPFDMRHPYDFDIRVPLVVRGPGIPENVRVSSPVSNVDYAPTFLDMAGILNSSSVDEDTFDGVSFLGLIENRDEVRRRKDLLVEYTGEGGHIHIDQGCVGLDTGEFYGCYEDYGCKCLDSSNNTYSCIRSISSSEDILFCEFLDTERFVEFYDLSQDPFQLNNTAPFLCREKIEHLKGRLNVLRGCRGRNCHDGQSRQGTSNHDLMLDVASLYLFLGFCLLSCLACFKICRHSFSDGSGQYDHDYLLPSQ